MRGIYRPIWDFRSRIAGKKKLFYFSMILFYTIASR